MTACWNAEKGRLSALTSPEQDLCFFSRRVKAFSSQAGYSLVTHRQARTIVDAAGNVLLLPAKQRQGYPVLMRQGNTWPVARISSQDPALAWPNGQRPPDFCVWPKLQSHKEPSTVQLGLPGAYPSQPPHESIGCPAPLQQSQILSICNHVFLSLSIGFLTVYWVNCTSTLQRNA